MLSSFILFTRKSYIIITLHLSSLTVLRVIKVLVLPFIFLQVWHLSDNWQVRSLPGFINHVTKKASCRWLEKLKIWESISFSVSLIFKIHLLEIFIVESVHDWVCADRTQYRKVRNSRAEEANKKLINLIYQDKLFKQYIENRQCHWDKGHLQLNLTLLDMVTKGSCQKHVQGGVLQSRGLRPRSTDTP